VDAVRDELAHWTKGRIRFGAVEALGDIHTEADEACTGMGDRIIKQTKASPSNIASRTRYDAEGGADSAMSTYLLSEL
jgi:hypothetical protein